jgi:hypothetical protein
MTQGEREENAGLSDGSVVADHGVGLGDRPL